MSEARVNIRAIGDSPLVRRLHQALAVGLALFMLTLVVLHERFQGYLAEVHLSGPSTAGLDLDDAVQWLKKTQPHLAAVATPAGEISAKCEIRATHVAQHPKQALLQLDDLADRWLYQYLPDRLQAYRHATLGSLRSTVTDARQREDVLQERLESLRQRQVAELRGAGTVASNQEPDVRRQTSELRDQKQNSTAAVKPSTEQDAGKKLRERLDNLRVQLSHLLGSHTDEHPEIVTLRSQISTLERELNASDSLSPSPSGDDSNAIGGQRQTRLSASQEVKQTSGELALGSANGALVSRADDLAAQIGNVMGELTKASRERQAAEQHLTERMQELSSQPTAAQWSAAPARVVTRLGGTPRSLTLALAAVLACVGGFAMFRVTAVESVGPKIESAAELGGAITLPVVADLQPLRADGQKKVSRGWQLVTPARLRMVTTVAEAFVAVAAGACLVSVVIDPSLGREVLADPFGTLSEVLGRCGA